jgi:HAMP domain-containing protein
MVEWNKLEKAVNSSIATAATLDPDSELVSHLITLKGLITKDQLKPQAAVETALSALVEETSKSSAEAQKAARAKSTNAQAAMVLAIAVLGGVLVVFSWLVVRSIVKPVEAMRQNIVAIARAKDFTLRLNSKSEDEIGQTIRAFNALITEIQESIRHVLTNAERISSAAQNASEASARVAESSNAQSEAAASMAAAVEEMTVSIDHVTSSSTEALMRAKAAGEDAGGGGSVRGRDGVGRPGLQHDRVGHEHRLAGGCVRLLEGRQRELGGGAPHRRVQEAVVGDGVDDPPRRCEPDGRLAAGDGPHPLHVCMGLDVREVRLHHDDLRRRGRQRHIRCKEARWRLRRGPRWCGIDVGDARSRRRGVSAAFHRPLRRVRLGLGPLSLRCAFWRSRLLSRHLPDQAQKTMVYYGAAVPPAGCPPHSAV